MSVNKAGKCQSSIKILFVVGTRPEAIKLAPVIKRFKLNPVFRVAVCVTSQHREMLDQVLDFFDVRPDFDLNIMKADQDLFDITTRALTGIRGVIRSYLPDWLFVQGDTTTTFAAALASFYERVKVAHIEAGLRSFRIHSPFPEEANRVLTTHLADLHFAPTETARKNVLSEGIPANIVFVVGNTSIDALFYCLKAVESKSSKDFAGLNEVNFSKKILLVTCHRRESFGRPFEEICQALKTIAYEEDVEIVYPVHLNPNVRKPVFKILKGAPKIHLMEPLEYSAFVWLMKKSYMILTDSGGIQEEAPSLGKPVLVMRDVTERREGVEAGTAVLVGTEKERIVNETLKLLRSRKEYDRISGAINPYGDGTASERIESIMLKLK